MKAFNWILGIGLISLIGLVISCNNINCNSPVKTAPVDSIWAKAKLEYPSFDTLKISKVCRNDSIIFKQIDVRERALRAEQERILLQHNRALDDIRQETNNYINKVNGWISVWIGVFALFGIILPIAIQFQLKLDYDKKIAEINNEIEDKKNEIDREIDQWKYSNLCRATSILYTHRLLEGVVDRRHSNELAQYWAEIIERFSKSSEECFDNGILKIDCYHQLLNTLLPLYGVVHEHHSLPNDIHHRKFDKIVDKIRILINKLTCGENLKSETLYEDLKEIVKKMSEAYSSTS